jgi:3-deoxy-7-phosphoheptulonate synthase
LPVRTVAVGSVIFGGSSPVLIGGPCAVEGSGMLEACARMVLDAGASMLRGGAFKPRTSPWSFQGLGLDGLRMLGEARAITGLPVVTEILSIDLIGQAMRFVDMIQVGARNMQNFPLLTELGRSGFPVLLKRGFMSTVEEWLLAAEYIVREGNDRVVLCERGIRTFEPWTRNTLDISGMILAREKGGFPVLADPCHSSGRRDLVMPLSRAALAAGADGLIIEVHPEPAKALSDGDQSLDFEGFRVLSSELRPPAGWAGRAPTGR